MMDRLQLQPSPEARLAFVARSLVIRMAPELPPNTPDYADFRDALQPYLQLELAIARFEEANLAGNHPRLVELSREMVKAYLAIAIAEQPR